MDGQRAEAERVLPETGVCAAVAAATSPRFKGIAAAKGYDQENGPYRIKKVNYSHEALVDYLLANPGCHLKQAAEVFGVSVQWVYRIHGSDAFQAYLAARRSELTDPALAESLEERIKGLAFQSIEVLQDKLAATQNPDLALKSLEIATKTFDFGARNRGPGGITNNFVVALPAQAPDAASWADRHRPVPAMIEAEPMSTTISRDPTIQPKPLTPSED